MALSVPTPLSVLIVHNEYVLAGGEDSVLQAERDLLRAHGDRVDLHIVTSKSIKTISQKLAVAWNFSHSRAAKREIKEQIRKLRPDVVHVHNFVPLITPSVFDACQEAGVPVVQTLHNFRYLCSPGVLLRNGEICEQCIGGSHYHAALHKCYRGSFIQSMIHANMLERNRGKRGWIHKVDRFIAVSAFTREKYIEGGFSPERLVVKYNFLPDSMAPPPANVDDRWRTPKALFVGRVDRVKGVRTMIEAWQDMDIPLDVIGPGPLLEEIRERAPSNVNVLGAKSRQETMAAMRQATFLVMPSEWYETCPMVLVEGMAHGLPIVASRLGGMKEIILDGDTGLLFEPGNADDLEDKARWMFAHPREVKAMSHRARAIFEQRYSADQNYRELRKIYEDVIAEHRAGRRAMSERAAS